MKRYNQITSWDELPILMDLAEAAAFMGVSPVTLRKRIERGSFPAVKAGGGTWIVSRDRLKDVLTDECGC